MSRPFLIHVVLVRTLYDSNIGAVSRAMANMGAARLILLDCKCQLTYSAQQAAASGQEGLANRIEYKSWEELLEKEPDGIRFGFTARDGKLRQVWDASQLFTWLKENDVAFQREGAPLNFYLVFGPEDWGLANSDLDYCQYSVNIPTFGDNTSLNLAQAALLGQYLVRQVLGSPKTALEGQQPIRKAREQITLTVDQTLRSWLEDMGFNLKNRRISVYTVLRKMLLHNNPSVRELRMLEIVLQQSKRKLQEWKSLQSLKKAPPKQDPDKEFLDLTGLD